MANEYIYSASLNQLFRDKDTGEPLVGGKIFFYEDKNRTTLKPVYTQSGAPGAYTYTPYPTQADGSISINNAGMLDEPLYLYPFDAQGAVDLYFVQVQSALGVVQTPSLEGFPLMDISSGPSSLGVVSHNYISNGQFSVRKVLPEAASWTVGEIREAFTDIDGNNWGFERDATTTAQDFIDFSRVSNYQTVVPSNPRYNISIRCTNEGGGSTRKDLFYRWADVNMFASENGKCTFSFWGKATANTQVEILFVRDYGTGGSNRTEQTIGHANLTTLMQQTVVSFAPGGNSGKTIGANDDDYAQIVIRFPTDSIYETEFTNFVFYEGTVAQPLFPPENPWEVITSVNALNMIGSYSQSASSVDFGPYILCDGRELLRAEYYKLFQAIGLTYGTPSTNDYFKIPDLRGRMCVSSGTGTGLTERTLGATGGSESVMLTEEMLAHHQHEYTKTTKESSAVDEPNPNLPDGHITTQPVEQTLPQTYTQVVTPLMNPFSVVNTFIYSGKL